LVVAAIKEHGQETIWYPQSPFSGVSTCLCVDFPPLSLAVANNPYQALCISMGAIRTTLVLASLLAPAAFAAPAANTAATPFGEYPAANVHAVPECNGSEMRADVSD